MNICVIFTFLKKDDVASQCKKYKSFWFWEDIEIKKSLNYVQIQMLSIFTALKNIYVSLVDFFNGVFYLVGKIIKFPSILYKMFSIIKLFAKFYIGLNLTVSES